MKMSSLVKRKAVDTEPEPAAVVEGHAVADTDRLEHIAVAAYYKAEARGFEAGHELDDWLKAELEMAKTKAETEGTV